MAISPLEMNGAITRTQDFSTIKHNTDSKSMIDQSNIQTQFHKEVTEKTTQVHNADDTEHTEYKYDAKEKGNGHYEGNSGKKHKKKDKKEEGKVIVKGQNRFDIKI